MKKKFFLFLLLLMTVLSINAISAGDFDNDNITVDYNSIDNDLVDATSSTHSNVSDNKNNDENAILIESNNNSQIEEIFTENDTQTETVEGDVSFGLNNDTNISTENIDITVDYDGSKSFETFLSENSLNQSGKTTINFIVPVYDYIKINYDNPNRQLVINGNNAIVSNMTVTIKNSSTVTINSLTIDDLVRIINNGTLYLKNISFDYVGLISPFLIENNQRLFIENCTIEGACCGALLNNTNLTVIQDSKIINHKHVLSPAMFVNQGKLLINNTEINQNLGYSFISDYYNFYTSGFFKYSELVILNSKIYNFSHLNPFIHVNRITVINSSFVGIKECSPYGKVASCINSEKSVLFNDSFINNNITIESGDLVSVNNYYENATSNNGVCENEEELYNQTNEYIENFMDDDILFFNKTEPIKTQIVIDDLSEAIYGENITIYGQLIDSDGVHLTNARISVLTQMGSFDTLTNECGVFNITLPINQMGKNALDVHYDGNVSYLSTSTFISLNVTKRASKIMLDELSDVQYTDNVTITGKYMDTDNNYLRYTPILITVNGVRYVNKTNSVGDFAFTVKTNKLGENNVTVEYPGNLRYKGASDSKIFNVSKKDTIILFDTINDVQYTDNVTISGKYTDTNGVNLRYTPIILTFNNKVYRVTTNNVGEFNFTIRAINLGINNVSALYPGNIRYNKGENNLTFEVVKKDTMFSIDKISNVEYTDNVNISGRYTDSSYNNLRYTPINVAVNGNNFRVYTNSDGRFNFLIKASKIGINNVTVSFIGNFRYSSAMSESNFTVERKSTKFTLNPIAKASYSDDVEISGKYMDSNGNNLRYTPVKLTLNNRSYYLTTNALGDFSLTVKAVTLGLNQLNVSYSGNLRYAGASINSTFKVVPKDTVITMKLSQKQAKSNITLRGNFTDNSGRPLRYTPLTVNLNGNKNQVVTDINGAYAYSFLPKTSGSYILTVSYSGNVRYAATQITKTFKIVNK